MCSCSAVEYGGSTAADWTDATPPTFTLSTAGDRFSVRWDDKDELLCDNVPFQVSGRVPQVWIYQDTSGHVDALIQMPPPPGAVMPSRSPTRNVWRVCARAWKSAASCAKCQSRRWR